MKRYLLLPIASLLYIAAGAQNASQPTTSRSGTSKAAHTASWGSQRTAVQVSFAGSSQRFDRNTLPAVKISQKWTAAGWKGEKVQTQLLIWSAGAVADIRVATSDLKDKRGNTISKNNLSTGFVQYVMTDEFRNGCGYRKPADFDSSLVADIIQTGKPSTSLEAQTVQPVWISISIPASAKAGIYTGTVTVVADKTYKLPVSLTVVDRTLPAPDQWTYQLDLWQHPAAVARVHQVALWSDAHFDLMRKYYTMLAAAGQKNITASIVHEPWGHQTYDDYPSLIKWTKTREGKWQFDYTLFDKYVSFVMSCGIKGRINCYSMVPWKIAFTYYDEALGRDSIFTGSIGSPEYNAFWRPMLTDFTQHLKAKGWFNITAIAMDERPLAAMQSVIALLKSVDKDWKVALAGNYHGEIESDIEDYCIASEQQFPAAVLAKRKSAGKLSTWYTCCSEKYPNGFTFSPPDEHVWMGWYTAATGMDGYLRWAYNSWTKQPLTDSRFTAWPAGDTYQVYPGPLSSIRFEKLIEGIQDYEKIQILRKEYRTRNQTARLNELETALQQFKISSLAKTPAAEMVAKAKGLLNQ
ncbi:glycoside hydrolase domain-containing protein [Paraflavitalea sp. CAU 1676]|uniref:DUF4091 domain-containing protein n=1 Tax=Paraflavitalea sp. CAU 1676 TaxID=3032598 RepID=UPI0023DC37D7|nr:glycoside hydrolase domain-containing protein [Paraflavitalea sp. CAU 1676]MDF2188392.1 DUF6067 family protein [Paraflavitalea sp. CAU 1676]